MKLRKMTYTRDGETRYSDKWYAVWVDHSEVLRRLPLLSDRRASTEIANKIDKLHQLKAAGGCLSPELVRYLDVMPRRILKKLVEWRLLDCACLTAGKPLLEHLDDWKRSIIAKGGTSKHAAISAYRVSRLFEECSFATVGEVSVGRIQVCLAKLRQDRVGKNDRPRRGLSAASSNYYQISMKSFLQWMVREGRAPANPLAHIKGLNVNTDRRHDRRALRTDELVQLITHTEKAAQRFGMSGLARSLLYRLAVETGLRAAELRSLTRTSFDFRSSTPTVTVEAAFAKNRRRDAVPIRSATADVLNPYLAKLSPLDRVFNMPNVREVVRMLRKDLAEARESWIASGSSAADRENRLASEFLVYRNPSGLVIDFHAFRHTFISNLVAGGVHPKIAQTLARHSTITLTMDRYSHVDRTKLAVALSVLPDLNASVPKSNHSNSSAENADEAGLSVDLPPAGNSSRCLVEFSGGWDLAREGHRSTLNALEIGHFLGKQSIETDEVGYLYATASNSAA